MKKTIFILAALIFGQTASASSYFITCTNAEGSITNVSGHSNQTTIRYYDWSAKVEVVEKIDAQLETLENVGEKLDSGNSGQAGCGGFGGRWTTQAVRAQLNVEGEISEKLAEVIGDKPQVFLCKTSWSWMAPPCN